jgi:hypothetical protein
LQIQPNARLKAGATKAHQRLFFSEAGSSSLL